ncbi:MAG TPA: vWA domain-containing protein, partial [Bacillota bacterium]|nr:vWA domain-containing protein [Bacillota bacterium]
MKTKKILAWTLVLMMLLTSTPLIAFADGDKDWTTLQPGDVMADKRIVGYDSDGDPIVKLEVRGKPVKTDLGADVILIVDNSGSMGGNNGQITYTEECGGTVTKAYGTWYCNEDYRHSYGSGTTPSGTTVKSDGHGGWICTKPVTKTTHRIDLAKEASKAFVQSVLGADSKNEVALIGFSSGTKNSGTHLNETGSKPNTINFTTNYTMIETRITNMSADGGTNYTEALQKAIGYADSRANKDKPLYVVM